MQAARHITADVRRTQGDYRSRLCQTIPCFCDQASTANPVAELVLTLVHMLEYSVCMIMPLTAHDFGVAAAVSTPDESFEMQIRLLPPSSQNKCALSCPLVLHARIGALRSLAVVWSSTTIASAVRVPKPRCVSERHPANRWHGAGIVKMDRQRCVQTIFHHRQKAFHAQL